MKNGQIVKFRQGIIMLLGTLWLTGSLFATVISGTVTNGNDGTPVDTLELYFTTVSSSDPSDSSYITFTATTDADGNYQVEVTEYGYYAIFIQDQRFSDYYLGDVEINSDNAVEMDFTVYPVQQPDASLHGHVSLTVNGAEEDAENVEMFIFPTYDSSDVQGKVEVYQKLKSRNSKDGNGYAFYVTTTDADGDYQVDVLHGDYVIYICENSEHGEYFSPIITVDEGQDFAWDIALDGPAAVYTLSGTVANYNPAVYYSSIDIISLDGWYFYSTWVNYDGSYTADIKTGKYIVILSTWDANNNTEITIYYDGAESIEDATPVDLTGGNAENINFTLPDPGEIKSYTISGYVKDETTGDPIGNAYVFVMGNYYGAYFDSSQIFLQTDENGYFESTGKFWGDSASLYVSAWTDGYYEEFYKEKAFFHQADEIKIGNGQHLNNINFTLLPEGVNGVDEVSVSGKVETDDDSPLEFGSVVAFDANEGYLLSWADIAGDGTYSLGKLPKDGKVLIQAWSANTIPEFYDDAVTWDEADILTLDGDISGINFVLSTVEDSSFAGAVNGKITASASSKNDVSVESATVLIREAGKSKWISADLTNDKGSFGVRVKTYGVYELKVSAPGYDVAQQTVEVNETTGLKIDNLLISLKKTSSAVGDNEALRPETVSLSGAYPNPFNPSTNFVVKINQAQHVEIAVFNTLGQKVSTLFSGKLNAGSKTFTWNGMDDTGRSLSSGVYFIRLVSNEKVITRSVVFMK
jgi:hypothetical protein